MKILTIFLLLILFYFAKNSLIGLNVGPNTENWPKINGDLREQSAQLAARNRGTRSPRPKAP